MLKPPINHLVEKIADQLGSKTGSELGNRYSLVLAVAKRARVIALNEEKEKVKEAPTFETRLSDKYKNLKPVIKPIHRAIDEFYGEKIKVYVRTPEEMKAEFEATSNEENCENNISVAE